jgi:hypothetical protein
VSTAFESAYWLAEVAKSTSCLGHARAGRPTVISTSERGYSECLSTLLW